MIVLNNISLQLKGFRLRDITLRIAPGEYRILLGPTGSGKTVLLETIAGLHLPQSGSIFLHDRNITNTTPENRNIGVVYQDYCLFPHLTVFDNIAFGLKLQKKTRSEIAHMVDEMAGFLNINHLLKRTQQYLSGGECQRVALARTLVLKPSLLLLDEPLSAVDRLTRNHLRFELQRIHRELGLAVLHVTHDVSEAFLLGDTMTVMRDGKIEQDGTPDGIFQKPATRFVAELLGIKNFLPVIIMTGSVLEVQGLGKIHSTESFFAETTQEGGRYIALFPDWAVELSPARTPSAYFWQGSATVKKIRYTDNMVQVVLETVGNIPIFTSFSRREMNGLADNLTLGSSIQAGILQQGVHLLAEDL
ncbi:MAG: ABC transporter [Desulfobulbus sp.]|nr:MAG: ABC transporter [Desulfobulbus sp.]